MGIPIRIKRVGLGQRITQLRQKPDAILTNGRKVGQPLVGFDGECRMPPCQQTARPFQDPQLGALGINLYVVRFGQCIAVNFMIQADGAHRQAASL